ncbi:MAG TPA: type II toxin-antitoxin system VapC family toxin [Stellaceae bacterium]|nr:type II toxin-antitoxin system VapC family toxin [Stellaceae bacterium]
MIILDTNVISEVMRSSPNPVVLGWLRDRVFAELATTTITIAEIRYGLARLPFGRRRRDLEMRLDNFMARGFSGRLFDFDAAAADAYGDIVVARERIGRRLEGFDGLIAAIAKSRGLAVATRDTGDFENCGVPVISPWESPAAPA